MGVLECEMDGHVALVTLNRPESRNSLDPELIVTLADLWSSLGGDDAVRAVVVTGAEGSTFCSGFDLGTTIPLMTGTREPQNKFEQVVANDNELTARATLRGHDLGKPLIAAVNGHAIAGGMELMLSCDLRVVAQGVKLGLSEVALGLIPGMGGTALLGRRVASALAMELLLGAQPIVSDDLAQSGLFNRLVPKSDVLSTALDLAQIIASNAPLAVKAARKVLRASADIDESTALALESEAGTALINTEDAVEGPLAFMEKRAPQFRGR